MTLVNRLTNINGNEREEAELEGKDLKEYTVLEISRCRRARASLPMGREFVGLTRVLSWVGSGSLGRVPS